MALLEVKHRSLVSRKHWTLDGRERSDPVCVSGGFRGALMDTTTRCLPGEPCARLCSGFVPQNGKSARLTRVPFMCVRPSSGRGAFQMWRCVFFHQKLPTHHFSDPRLVTRSPRGSETAKYLEASFTLQRCKSARCEPGSHEGLTETAATGAGGDPAASHGSSPGSGRIVGDRKLRGPDLNPPAAGGALYHRGDNQPQLCWSLCFRRGNS